MCGYQPLQKWLKDRKGRYLTEADVLAFRQIQEVVDNTIEIMNEMKKNQLVSRIIP